MTRLILTSAMCVALVASSADAFAGPPSSFVGRRVVVPVVHQARAAPLSMNLFDRFTRVAKSNLDSILKNLEDPEKIMNQALEDMQVSRIYAEC